MQGPPPKQLSDERTIEMSEPQDLNKFRVWLGVTTAVIYVFLAVTGNA